MQQRNTIRYVLVLGLALGLLQITVYAGNETPERIEWNKAPIRLELSVGQEQRIEFPAAVKVGLPDALQTVLRSQSVNGTVYWLPQAPFNSSRILVRELDSGRIYLFDVTATGNGETSHPIQIYVTDTVPSGIDIPVSGTDVDQGSPDYIQLTRFAAQQLYAPTRLLKDQLGMVRVPVARDSVALYHGGAIEATPLVAWRAYGRYVTAVKLSNRTAQPQTLDPRHLRGAWLTVTFQHHRLLPQGDEADTTVVYLISARPFAVAHQE